MRPLCLLLLLATLLSCTNQNGISVLNTDVLPTQTFRINTASDTVVKTAAGASLRIGKESFSGGGEVELEVKEAYSMQDIIKAGLTTESDGQPLSSGGMIYVGAKEKGISLTKPVDVKLPTKDFDADMKIFEGKETDGEINWTQPKPLEDSVPRYIKGGKAIFDANCVICHALDIPLTGPALHGVEHRGPWNNRQALFAFTQNPGAYIPLTSYTRCLAGYTYGGQIMPSFPQLSDTVLAAVYDYIKYDEAKKGLAFYRDPCEDSCRRYDSVIALIAVQRLQREKLVKDNGPMSDYTNGVPLQIGTGGNSAPGNTDTFVTMEENNAEYYQFKISTFGWFNVDRLMKEDEDFKESRLTVTLTGEQKQHVDVFLIIPSVKVFAKAGRTDNEDEFAFDTKDGKLPLPQGAKAYIFAVSENENGILYALKEFSTSLSQNIAIEVKASTKEEMYAAVDALQLKDVSVKVEDAKNATEIRAADKNVKALQNEAEKLLPANCHCFCNYPKEVGLSGDSIENTDVMQIVPMK